MKTALVSPCFLEGTDALGNDRFARNRRYLDYYLENAEELEIDEIHLFDNASRLSFVAELSPGTVMMEPHSNGWIKAVLGPEKTTLWSFAQRLERGPRENDYPYCWRALYAIHQLIGQGFEKIIQIDSDGFVLTRRLARFIRECNTGWQSFYCPRGGWPESSIFILNRDAFGLFGHFTDKPWEQQIGPKMEEALPFTAVSFDFVCDRFGEKPRESWPQEIDYFGQAPLDIQLRFGEGWKL